jgi:nitrogen fixation/metabolism regulation signal transduction histidine kinase
MILRRFYIAVIARVMGIVLTSILFALALLHLNHLFTILITGALIVVQTIWLIVYINRINVTLEKFFLAIKNDDSSISYSQSGRAHIYRNLRKLLDEVMHAISRVKIEKEHQFQYLQYVMEHVDTGLLAYSEDGKIELFNRSAKKLFNDFEPFTLKQLNRVRPGVEQELKDLSPGRQKLVTVGSGSGELQLAVRKSRFRIDEKEVNLVSLQDIHLELDRKELSSWKKLIRVLRHEIMNTVSPIASLATTLSRIFSRQDVKAMQVTLSEQNLQDMVTGLDIIRKRSRGLLDFVEQYRKLTRLPEPQIDCVNVNSVLQDTVVLSESEPGSIKVMLDCAEDLEIMADRKLIEQAMINLVKNATESVSVRPDPVIELSASEDMDGRVNIRVKDNGPGIPGDVLPNIFIPFYSTKESGSGIGLSISRQIMDMHGGKLTVYSVPDKETVFSLVFQKSVT